MERLEFCKNVLQLWGVIFFVTPLIVHYGIWIHMSLIVFTSYLVTYLIFRSLGKYISDDIPVSWFPFTVKSLLTISCAVLFTIKIPLYTPPLECFFMSLVALVIAVMLVWIFYNDKGDLD